MFRVCPRWVLNPVLHKTKCGKTIRGIAQELKVAMSQTRHANLAPVSTDDIKHRSKLHRMLHGVNVLPLGAILFHNKSNFNARSAAHSCARPHAAVIANRFGSKIPNHLQVRSGLRVTCAFAPTRGFAWEACA